VEEAMQRVLGSPGLHGSMHGVPAEILQGSVRDVVYRRRAIAQAARLTGGGSGRKFGACRLEIEGSKLGENSWQPGGAPAVLGEGGEVVKRRGRGGGEL